MADPCPTSINDSAGNGDGTIRYSDTKQYEHEHDHEEYAGGVLSTVGGRCACEAEGDHHRDGGVGGCVCGDCVGVLVVLQILAVSVASRCKTRQRYTRRYVKGMPGWSTVEC